MQTVLASADSAVRKQIGEFHICSFDGLTTRELYEILRAREIYLESQKHAEGFYLKADFETMSADFIEAGYRTCRCGEILRPQHIHILRR